MQTHIMHSRIDNAAIVASSLSENAGLVTLTGPATGSGGRIIAYWIATSLVALPLVSGGAGDIMRIQPVIEGMTHLGYPTYFCVILGVWKLLGAATLLVPRFPRLKEWAYAGILFDLTGAIASRLAVGDGASKLVAPIIFTTLMAGSWALRPATRRLDNTSF